MSKHRFFGPQRPLRTTVRTAAVVLFAAVSVLAHAATTDHIWFSGAEGSAYGYFSDSCTSAYVEVHAGATGTNNLQAQATPFATGFIYGYNSCTNTFVYEFGYGQGAAIQFSSDAGNGNQLPKSVTASGQIQLYNYYTGGNDNVTFQMTLRAIGIPYDFKGDSQITYPTSSTSSVTVHEHDDYSQSPANASLYVSTQSFGALSLPNPYGFTYSSRFHQVDITH
ncbi:hypothetical protein [Burkholderia sp. PU8-34]